MIYVVFEVHYGRGNLAVGLSICTVVLQLLLLHVQQALIIKSKATKDEICGPAEFCCIHDITRMQKKYWSMSVNGIMFHTVDGIKTFPQGLFNA